MNLLIRRLSSLTLNNFQGMLSRNVPYLDSVYSSYTSLSHQNLSDVSFLDSFQILSNLQNNLNLLKKVSRSVDSLSQHSVDFEHLVFQGGDSCFLLILDCHLYCLEISRCNITMIRMTVMRS